MDTSHAYNGAKYNTTEYSPYMNIDVQAPPDDFGSSEGLCGNWNGDNSDDSLEETGFNTNHRPLQTSLKVGCSFRFFSCCFSLEIKRGL